MTSHEQDQQLSRRWWWAARLIWYAIALVVTLIGVRAAYDVRADVRVFPGWFSPVFTAAVIGLGLYTLLMAIQLGRHGRAAAATTAHRPLGRYARLLLACAPPISVLLTSSLHLFAPFIVVVRPELASQWDQFSPMLQFNLLLTLAALPCTILAGVLLYRNALRSALVAYGVISLLLLVPNDDCGNPFNAWWIEVLGASPLMFLPVIYTILFTVAALLRVHPRTNLLALGALGAGALFLGLGHIFRFLW